MGLAAAVVVAVAIAIGIGLASHHQGLPPSALGNAADRGGQASGQQARNAESLARTPGTAGQTPGISGREQTQSPAAGPRAVVVAYYAAINRRDWGKVWQLGGQNLSTSYQAMVDGYADTARDVIRSIRVIGDHVQVRLRAYETGGTLQVYDVVMVVRDGVITAASQYLLQG
jgi:hypothetical protein